MPELRTINDALRELRRVATFVAFGNEFTQRMKKGELHKHVALVFHGNPKNKSAAPYSEQICKGLGAFKDLVPDLYDTEAVRLTSPDGDTADSQPLTRFYIKEELLLDKSRHFSVGESATCDINPRLLSVKTVNSKEVITGKTLFNETKDEVFLNCKKALSHAKEWLNDDGSLPSGKFKEDYIAHVRECMYRDFKSQKENDTPVVDVTSDEEDEADTGRMDDDDDAMEEEVPQHWIFEGHLTFFVLGPLSTDPSKLLNVKDPTEKCPEDTRRGFRKKQSEDKKIQRSCAAASQLDGPTGLRGYTMADNLTVARMWQHDMQQQHRALQDKMLAIQIQLTSLQEDAKLAADSARATGDSCDWDECRELRAECKRKRTEIDALTKQVEDIANSDRAKNLKSFFDSMAGSASKQAKISESATESSSDGERSGSHAN